VRTLPPPLTARLRYKDCEDRCSQAANLAEVTRVRLSDLIAAYAASVVGQVTIGAPIPRQIIVTIKTLLS
jgi:hypothetical protein